MISHLFHNFTTEMFSVRVFDDELIEKIRAPNFVPDVEISDANNPRNVCVLDQTYANHAAELIKKFEVYEDDVWVVSFPKCGTTWTQEMVWLINNDLNYATAKSQTLKSRFPYLE